MIDQENDVPQGVLAVKWRESKSGKKPPEIAAMLLQLCTQPKGSAFHQLQTFRKYLPDLIDYTLMLQEIADKAVEYIDRQDAKSSAKSRKRWTQDEEELLIEMAVRDSSLIELSLTFGRSPSAIKTKISELVGLQRMSTAVAGKFIGTIDGQEISGLINGTVTKEK